MMEDLYSKATSTCQHRVSNSVLAKMGKLRAVGFRVKRHLEAPLKKSIVATSIRGRSQPKRKWQAAILNRLAQCGRAAVQVRRLGAAMLGAVLFQGRLLFFFNGKCAGGRELVEPLGKALIIEISALVGLEPSLG